MRRFHDDIGEFLRSKRSFSLELIFTNLKLVIRRYFTLQAKRRTCQYDENEDFRNSRTSACASVSGTRTTAIFLLIRIEATRTQRHYVASS
jgi:hypothetical protein